MINAALEVHAVFLLLQALRETPVAFRVFGALHPRRGGALSGVGLPEMAPVGIFHRGMDILGHVANTGNVFLPEPLLSSEARERDSGEESNHNHCLFPWVTGRWPRPEPSQSNTLRATCDAYCFPVAALK